MKTARAEDLRNEYSRADLGKGTRGKYYEEYTKGANLVLISPDIAAAFPDEEAVNNALRRLLELAKTSTAPTVRRRRTRQVVRG